MKPLAYIRTTRIRALLATFVLAFGLASCESIFEGEGDCSVTYRVRFTYDYNMKFADAFAQEVEAVSLYIFDEDGRFVSRTAERGDALKQEGYTLPLDLKAGRYTLVAWCGLDGKNDSYLVPDLTPGISTLSDLTCRMDDRRYTLDDPDGTSRPTDAYVHEIDNLYHGMATIDLPNEPGTHTAVLALTKNTNYVRIVLQHLSGSPVNPDDFRFAVTDENALMNYDNSLLPDEPVTYYAWHTSQGTADMEEDDTPAGSRSEVTSVSVAVAEITVNRLVQEEGHRPVLTVTRATPEADGTYRHVLSIPLIDYALPVKGYYNRCLSDQEYLDRQDEYNYTLFLDENDNWISSSIIINSWRVVLSDVEI